MNAVGIARVCHEVNRAYSNAIGDFPTYSWEELDPESRGSIVDGVLFHLSGDHPPDASHRRWMDRKLLEGWAHGPEKSLVRKTHPCLLPFDELPKEQQAKDHIFRAIVHALREHP